MKLTALIFFGGMLCAQQICAFLYLLALGDLPFGDAIEAVLRLLPH